MTTETNNSGLTEEQINQMAIAKIDEELAKLKTELEKIDAENYTGTSREIKQQVGQNTRARYELEQEKWRLQKLRDHIEGPSEGVKSFLNQEEPVSKFDVDAGKVTLEEDDPDTNRLKGKPLF
jgi:predicted RNase H-like nuclease (RuvC/YqgF family)